jgi:hypothetical protein
MKDARYISTMAIDISRKFTHDPVWVGCYHIGESEIPGIIHEDLANLICDLEDE